MKRLRRDWSDAGHRGRGCRVAELDPSHTCDGPRELAHVSGRRHELPDQDGVIRVNPFDVVPLCRGTHRLYDTHQFDLVPYLTAEEQARAVVVLGGLYSAIRRLSG